MQSYIKRYEQSLTTDSQKQNFQEFLTQLQKHSIETNKIERYFALYQFEVKYLLSSSDCESISLKDLLSMADEECKSLWENLSLGYTQSKAHPFVAQEICNLYNNNDYLKSLPHNQSNKIIEIVPENIIEIAPQEGIFISMFSLLQPGDHVVAISPAYQSLQEVARFLSCEISYWKLEEKEEQNLYTCPTTQQQKSGLKPVFDIENLKSLVKPETKLVIVNFPHNPTGFIPTQQEYNQIIDICRSNNAYLFSDEMYRGLQPQPEMQLLSGCQLYENCLTLCGLSKTYSMPGLRQGWLITQNTQIIQKLIKWKDYTTVCGNSCSQVLTIIALRNHKKIEDQNNTIIQSNLQALQTFCQKHSEKIDYVHPSAGSMAFLKFKNWSSSEYSTKMAEENGIMILPGSQQLYTDDYHFRLGLGRQNFQEVLKIWDGIIEKQPL